MGDINIALYCNFKKCRASITSTCWITSCSHVLCNNHGHIDDGIRKQCPVCNTLLDRQLDFVQININPPEEYKTMVLAGLSPGTVFDIASRALAFWNFQQHIERTNQSLRINHLSTRVAQLQSSYETMANKVKNDFQMEALKKKTLHSEIHVLTSQLQEANKCIFEKSRQLQNLQLRYDELRRETVTAKAREEEIIQSQQEQRIHNFMIQDNIHKGPLGTPRFQPNRLVENSQNCHIAQRSNFKFNPVTPRTRHQ